MILYKDSYGHNPDVVWFIMKIVYTNAKEIEDRVRHEMVERDEEKWFEYNDIIDIQLSDNLSDNTFVVYPIRQTPKSKETDTSHYVVFSIE